jgi:hypothetical protein
MLEVIEGLPDNVVGIVAKGRVTKKDVADVLMPTVGKALEWHHRLRLYYEIRTRYPGAAWEEVNLGAGQAVPWERVAIVSDVAWIRHAVTALRLIIPSEVRVFVDSQIPESLAWITDTELGRRRPPVVRRPAGAAARSFRPAPQYLHQVS